MDFVQIKSLEGMVKSCAKKDDNSMLPPTEKSIPNGAQGAYQADINKDTHIKE